jgi:hypothetical protein
MNHTSQLFFTMIVGLLFFGLFMPSVARGDIAKMSKGVYRWLKSAVLLNGELGGYVHDTAFSQFIFPTSMICITGTWTEVAGQVSGTVVKHVAATDETSTVYIPILIPSNSVSGKGSYLKSIEVDYEILVAACDAVDALIYKVTRGADGAVAVVDNAVAFDYDTGHDTAAERYDVDQHRMTLTLTTPAWIDNDEYYMAVLAFNKAATTTVDVLGAVANYTLRA